MILPSLFGEMDLHQRNWHHFAVSGNQKNVQKGYTNSVFFPPNNEKQAIQAKQDHLKRERYKPEHKAPKHHVEVAMNDLHRNSATYDVVFKHW